MYNLIYKSRKNYFSLLLRAFARDIQCNFLECFFLVQISNSEIFTGEVERFFYITV